MRLCLSGFDSSSLLLEFLPFKLANTEGFFFFFFGMQSHQLCGLLPKVFPLILI